MSQDNRAPLQCSECKRVIYNTKRNKRTLKERLALSKFCKFCRKHTATKETK